jgi:glycosyltransferase involved in cell wall biosynthesis
VSELQFDARVWKEVRSLAHAGYRVTVLGCSTESETTVRSGPAPNISVVEFPFGSRGRRVRQSRRLTAVARMWAEVLRTPARVYHAHNIHTFPPAYLASRLRKARLVYDAHELYGDPAGLSLPARLAATAAARLQRFAVRRSDLVFTTNRSRLDVLAAQGGRAPIAVLANVPAIHEHVEPVDPGYRPGRVTLLYQGGIYPQSRAFEEVIRALPELPQVDLVLLGFGRAATIAQVREWARRSAVDDRVLFLPPRPFDELVHTAAAATVGLVPIRPDSLGAYLGDTNKLFEYLMAGLPVVASDLPEIRKVVESTDPPVGEVFDPASPADIADAVRRVLDDPARYDERRRAARRVALERFNWQREQEELLRCYDELATRGATTMPAGRDGR